MDSALGAHFRSQTELGPARSIVKGLAREFLEPGDLDHDADRARRNVGHGPVSGAVALTACAVDPVVRWITVTGAEGTQPRRRSRWRRTTDGLMHADVAVRSLAFQIRVNS